MERTNQKHTCIIHCRVSSSRQLQNSGSLDVQESICQRIAADKGWHIAKTWREGFSGRKNIRPVFIEILNYLDKHPRQIHFYLFRAIDRFTRTGSYGYEQMKRELSKRGVEMIDSFGIIQPSKNTLEDFGFEYDWSKTSPSEISELVMATTAKSEVTTILTRMIGQEIWLTKQGYQSRGSQDGYLNKKVYVEGKKRTIQVPDLERAKYYIAMFTMRASGQYTDKEIVERINAMGYRTKLQNKWDKGHEKIIGQTGNNPLDVRAFQVHIKKPIYCGVVWEKWTNYKPIKAQYEGLVSIEMFNAANRGKLFIKTHNDGGLEMLYNYRPDRVLNKKSHQNPLFPYKNVILCDLCRKPFAGSEPRSANGKKHPTYHCSRGHKYYGIRKATFDMRIEGFIKELEFQPDILRGLNTVLIGRYHDRQSVIMQSASEVGRNVVDLETQKAQVIKAYRAATSDLMRREMENEAEKLDGEIKEAQTERNRLEITEADINDFIMNAKKILEQPSELLLNPVNTRQQQSLFGLIFEEPPTYEQIGNGTAKLSWLFRVSSKNADGKSVLAGLQCLEWNKIEATILRWKEVYRLLENGLSSNYVLN